MGLQLAGMITPTSTPFYGIVPGKAAMPLGQITLPVPRVASLGEPMDVSPQGLVGLLLVALEVLGVSWADVRPLEIPDEGPIEVRPVTDAVMWK